MSVSTRNRRATIYPYSSTIDDGAVTSVYGPDPRGRFFARISPVVGHELTEAEQADHRERCIFEFSAAVIVDHDDLIEDDVEGRWLVEAVTLRRNNGSWAKIVRTVRSEDAQVAEEAAAAPAPVPSDMDAASEAMADLLRMADPGGPVLLEYSSATQLYIYTPLDAVRCARWKLLKNSTGTWGFAGLLAGRLLRTWHWQEAGIFTFKNDAGVAWTPGLSSTAAALGGVYTGTSTAGRYVEWQITGFSELWINHALRTTGLEYAELTIDGAATLINQIPVVGGKGQLPQYAAVDDHNVMTLVATGLNPATTYTVRLRNNGNVGGGGGTFMSFGGHGYPSADMSDTRVSGPIINNIIENRDFGQTSYIHEYAYEIKPVDGVTYEFSGLGHLNESIVAAAMLDDNGSPVAVSSTAPRLVRDALIFQQSITTRHPETDDTDLATVIVLHRFSSQGMDVWHRHTWLVPLVTRFSYAAMYAFDNTMSKGQVAGDTGNEYDLTPNNDAQHGKLPSRCAALWNPAFPYVGWLYMPDFLGVDGFVNTTLKLWIQDRSDQAGNLRDKIYYTRVNDQAGVPIAVGDVWENSAQYRLSYIENPDNLFPL